MKNIERFVNFSDAVIAIAVTLLVLPLTERAATAHITSYSNFMATFSQPLFIFALSFVVICRFWLVHHNLLNSLQSFNSRLFWLNAAWLLSIALIPFTSELIGNNDSNNSFIIGVYILPLLVISYLSLAIQQVAARSKGLHKPNADPSEYRVRGIATALAMTIAFCVGILFPSIGVLALILLVPAGYAGYYVRFRSLVARRKSSA